ncbi:hypothetical protein SCLCIDRAFT_1173084 [Scleroderma citrinum Foug A]|uniref:DNA-directed RNA polymerase n=1 Tax=Scleroderma citrinum Foug A TaxID=1036808 RepID=A0A0C3DS38_9AGAM|nr:hypothetical protein SCLCIDRAFT_1173084 [Scleroderma citrinum Foug A]
MAETEYIQHRLVEALKDVMVHYNLTMRNSLGDLIQFIYATKINTFVLSNKAFEHKYQVNVMDKEGGFPPGVLQIRINDSSLELQVKLDEEYGQLVRNRQQLCMFIFPRADGLTPHHIPANPYWIIQNAAEPSDLEPAYIVNAVQTLTKRLLTVLGDDTLSRGAQTNVSLTFRMHVCTTLAMQIEAKFNQSLVNPSEMCGILSSQDNQCCDKHQDAVAVSVFGA